jgi:hypothetical protein
MLATFGWASTGRWRGSAPRRGFFLSVSSRDGVGGAARVPDDAMSELAGMRSVLGSGAGFRFADPEHVPCSMSPSEDSEFFQ